MALHVYFLTLDIWFDCVSIVLWNIIEIIQWYNIGDNIVLCMSRHACYRDKYSQWSMKYVPPPPKKKKKKKEKKRKETMLVPFI